MILNAALYLASLPHLKLLIGPVQTNSQTVN